MNHSPHHDGSPLYVSDPAPALGQSVTLWVRVAQAAGVAQVHVRSVVDGEPRYAPATVDRQQAGETWWRVDLTVRHPLTHYRFLLTGVGGGYRWLTARGVARHDVPDDTDFRLLADDPPPGWATDAVVYEIFPDRFARSPAAADREPPPWAIPCGWDDPVIWDGPETPLQFYGGDLDGVIEHLDHIQGLGANTVYLTPIFPAPSNHRYNASAFDHVDPWLGGDEALHRLTKAVHGRGMRLIGDLTTNHTGSTHPWFTAAREACRSGPQSAFESPSDLYYFGPDGSYEAWWGFPTLPKLNWGSTELRRRFFDGPDSVTARWLTEFDGWRVDVANMTGRLAADDYTVEVAALVRAAAVAARPDALVVAEHNYDASRDLDRGGWHGTMNYSGFLRPLWTWLRSPEGTFPQFLGIPTPIPRLGADLAVRTIREFAARNSWYRLTHSWNLLDSHDVTRFRTITGDPALVEVGAGMLATMPGTPMLFAGDEFGLPGQTGEDARRPMPWHRQSTWDSATLARYRRLFALRNGHRALREGGLRWAHVSEDAVAYWRETATERLLVYARRAGGPPVELPGVTGTNLYGGAPLDGRLPGDGPTVQVWAAD